MGKVLSAALVMLGLPVVVFVGGAWLMLALSQRHELDQKPLNQRFGYRLHDVEQTWEALGKEGRGAEKTFLELDLVFPFLYGAALATGMLLAWAGLGRPFHPAWIVAPLAATLLADWVENLVQHSQLKRFIDHGGAALRESAIQVASTATIVKLLFFYGSWLFLFGLVVVLLVKGPKPV
jgi:hypothetical protein